VGANNGIFQVVKKSIFHGVATMVKFNFANSKLKENIVLQKNE